MSYMSRGTRYQTVIGIRLGEEDHRSLEAIAERERANISVVARRFIAQGLDREAGTKARQRRKQRKRP